MKTKRGQFYLVAAMIIISIIVGFSAVSNYSGDKREVRVFDVEKELSIESEQVIDYGIVSSSNITELLNDFVQKYSDYAGEGKNFYFIYGDSEKIYGYNYTQTSIGGVDVSVGSNNFGIESTTGVGNNFEVEPTNDKVIVIVDGVDYEFSLRPGQNFYYIISQEINGEEYVVRN